MCKSKGMRVLELDGQEEQKSIFDFLGDAGLASSAFFTSVGAGVNLGQPQRNTADDCYSLLESAIRLTPCSSKLHFICEDKKYLTFIYTISKN
jgi:hypothetical protein